MKREFSAGGIVYKRSKMRSHGEQGSRTNILWLVRRPTPNPEYKGNLGWSFPKGWIDEKETLEEAATREVREEGGVEARVIKKLPTLKIFFMDQKKVRVMKFVTYFVMEYVKDVPGGPGWETEEVKWVSLNEARDMLAFKNEKQLLEVAASNTNLRGVLV